MKRIKNIILLVLTVAVMVACDHRKELADAYGNFEVDDVIVSAEANGKMLEFNVLQGGEVSQGAVVGQIDTTTVQLHINQVDARIAAVKSKIAGVRAQIESQKQQKENLQVSFNRVEKLLSSGAATQQQYDDLSGNLKLVDKQIEASKTQITSIIKEAEVLKAQRGLLSDQLKKCSVVVPSDGIVLEKYIEQGELVSAGKPLFKLADLSTLNLRCFVSGDQLSGIKLGDKVKVFVDSETDEMIELVGTINWISDQAEFTPKIIQTKEERVKFVYALKVSVPNHGQLKLGMPGEMRIIQ